MRKPKKFKLGPRQRAWVRALRSGKYKQTTGKLARIDDKRHGYCCLGVLCELAVKAKASAITKKTEECIFYNDESDFLPFKVRRWAGLRDDRGTLADGSDLSELNDDNRPFEDIANTIEEQAAIIFRRSV